MSIDLDFELNADELYDPEKDVFKLIPEGWFSAVTERAELKLTKDGTGQYISLMFKISGPTHAGRALFDIFNIKNKSVEAETIGKQAVGKLMKALKLEKTGTVHAFNGKSVMIKVGQKELSAEDKKYAEAKGNLDTHKNVIVAYREFVTGSFMATNNAPIPTSSLPPIDDDLPF